MDVPAKLMPADPPARPLSETEWAAFVDSYGPVILEWFRQSGLPAADLHPVTREVLTTLRGQFSAVAKEADLKFRAWLQFAAHDGWCGLMENHVEAETESKNTALLSLLLSVEAHDLFLRTLDTECSRQRRREILGRVHSVADEMDWEAFQRAILKKQPIEDVARAFQCPPPAVSAALYRVQRVLLAELKRVEETN